MSAVVIIGGGPAGLSLAAGLSSVSDNITVIEKSTYNAFAVGEHVQSQILPIVNQLNIPTEILFNNSTPCNGIYGLWAAHPFESKSLFNPYGHDFIIHRPQFEKSLVTYLSKKGVKFYCGMSVKKIEQGKIFLGNKSITYDYLFDCSGRASRSFDNKRLIFDKLIGVLFYEPVGSEKDAVILIESTENGWWYHTQSKKTKITTFFTDADIYLKLHKSLQKELDTTNFIKKFCNKLSGNPIIKTAYTSILKSNPIGIWQLGDSYYSLDPLSSQGIYKAFNQALKIANLFSDKKLEESADEFYTKQRKEFLSHLYLREYHYNKGWLHYNSQFYKRRVALNLSEL